MSYLVLDVEADGPIPHDYSMVSFGAVLLTTDLDKTFYGQTRPISDKWIPEALAVSHSTRQEHEGYEDPAVVMESFRQWIAASSTGRPIFISDNPAFDWQWINWYFHHFLGANPFGFSARRIGDLYCGMKLNCKLNGEWKRKLHKTKNDHNPVNDAMGNAEALLSMKEMGLIIPTN